jgi:hypothetical protein
VMQWQGCTGQRVAISGLSHCAEILSELHNYEYPLTMKGDGHEGNDESSKEGRQGNA